VDFVSCKQYSLACIQAGNHSASRMNKPLPPVYFLATLVLVAVLHFVVPVYRYWALPLSLVGVVPLVFGVALNVTADNAFKQHDTTVKPYEQSSALVTGFPFSISRNPMYLGLTLMLFGVALLLGSISALVPGLVFPYLMSRVFIREEERMLAATFGADWERYQSAVRRWI
jgi:protein-S-isoprenylcysteine O-methyltransferase Ste14